MATKIRCLLPIVFLLSCAPYSCDQHRVGAGVAPLGAGGFVWTPGAQVVADPPVCVAATPTQMLPVNGLGYGSFGHNSVQITNPGATQLNCTTFPAMPPGNDAGPSTVPATQNAILTITNGYVANPDAGVWCSSTTPQDAGVLSNCTQVFEVIPPQ